jgi:hypothetical protein
MNGIKGRNQHGPWPKGQFIELSQSSYGSLTNFYNYNDPKNSIPPRHAVGPVAMVGDGARKGDEEGRGRGCGAGEGEGRVVS